MKKKIVVVLSLVLCLMLSISLAACNKNKHEAKSEWKFDNAQHWHECATKGHDDKLDVAAHTWDEGKITTDPTETTKGVKTFTCTVCNYQKTTPIDEVAHKHTYATEWSKDETNHWHAATCAHTDEKSGLQAHNFGEWTTKTPAGYHVNEVQQRKCSVCEYTEERTNDDTATHDPDNFKHDETNHWFECENCDEKVEIEAHTYGVWSQKTAAANDQNKEYSRKCTECEYEDVLTFDNTKTNGTYCVAITEVVKSNGKKYADVQVLRGTINKGDNLVIDGLDGTFTIEGMKDSNGKNIASASFGQSVSIEIGTEDGDLELVDNRSVGGHLAYEPNTANARTTFTAQITIDLSNFSGVLNIGRSLHLDLYNIDTGLITCNLVLPEGVNVVEDGKSYVVTITLPDSRVLWAGMEFAYKVYDSASSSYITVATGIILSVAA